jgi:hypothetical protein
MELIQDPTLECPHLAPLLRRSVTWSPNTSTYDTPMLLSMLQEESRDSERKRKRKRSEQGKEGMKK